MSTTPLGNDCSRWAAFSHRWRRVSGYLAERPDIFTKETNWEEDISLGEKQRLAIARLIYHKPTYAILDECTSAVSSVCEERLYWMLVQHGITYMCVCADTVARS